MPFDLSMTKLLVLAVIAMVIFGPEKLPRVARDAGRMLRQFRSFADQARADLKSELGDTVGDLDIRDLNPRTFVRKHLFDDDDAPVPGAAPKVDMRKPVAAGAAAVAGAAMATGMPAPRSDADASRAAAPGAPTPFDIDAT